MASETMFDSMNRGSKEVDEMSRMNAVDIADSRRNESLRSYAKESSTAGSADMGKDMDKDMGQYMVWDTHWDMG